MKIKLKLARYGMNMSEATIVEWFKEAGESFVEGDPLYSIETEKVTQVVDATASGRLLEIVVQAGEDAQVGDVIGIVDLEIAS